MPISSWYDLVKYLISLFRYKPDAYLGFTIKPVIYGGIAARIVRVTTIMTITGLGTIFIRESKLTKLAEALYRLSTRKANMVFFQNSDDLSIFLDRGLVTEGSTSTVPGSGVDLKRFRVRPMNNDRESGAVNFLMVSRLIRDKGVLEYVEAAEKIRERFPRTRFVLAGPAEVDNPTAIPRHQVKRWEANGTIEYVGYVDDVESLIEKADCVVLPSYREGLPRSLLEASAMGRPIIMGLRGDANDLIKRANAGITCNPENPKSINHAIEVFYNMPEEKLIALGENGLRFYENELALDVGLNKLNNVFHNTIKKSSCGFK